MYIVIRVTEEGGLRPGGAPFVHPTMGAAQGEAMRLSETYPEHSFRVFYSPAGEAEATNLGWRFKLVKKYAQIFY